MKRVQQKGGILQGPKSAVKLRIPDGLDALIIAHIHANPQPFLHAIPDSECLVASIVDYTCSSEDKCLDNKWFEIVVPHCIKGKEDLKQAKVRHGDIHNNVPFSKIPNHRNLRFPIDPSVNSYFEVNEKHFRIFTRGFCQFVCTVCAKNCDRQAVMLVFGSMTPPRFLPVTAALRLYICSPRFDLQDNTEVRIFLKKKKRYMKGAITLKPPVIFHINQV